MCLMQGKSVSPEIAGICNRYYEDCGTYGEEVKTYAYQ